MDGQRFDELTKVFTKATSRRGVLRGLAGGAAAAAAAALGRGAAAAPNRCAQGCAFEPKGPRQAACKQACKQCGGDFSRICSDVEIICCPPETFCCAGPAGQACCPFGQDCCNGQCVEPCPEGTFLDPGTCECVPFLNCAEFDCGADPCGFNPCGESPITGLCLCAPTTEEACACFQPICGVDGPCVTSDDCAEGFACVTPCCGEPLCVPLCGTPVEGGATGLTRWG